MGGRDRGLDIELVVDKSNMPQRGDRGLNLVLGGGQYNLG